ncbi:MAG: hypothetical protein ACSHYA_00285 [Opitutaceae bacterium]
MPSVPPDLDELFPDRGGFTPVYEKLILLARSLLNAYSGDSAVRVCLRQWDAIEIVDHAFERLLSEEYAETENAYYVLRNHVKNFIRTKAKSVQESRTVRSDGSEALTARIMNFEDRTDLAIAERAEIIDDVGFCLKVMQLVLTHVKNDELVVQMCEAYVAEIYEADEICQLLEISKKEYSNVFRRLQTQFRKQLRNLEKEDV